uniref:SGNH hydrolase-type esterase domain-containing protein n=1 Tax=Knipowitschia caucasica TaxID=637954 RepID=A0AAV2KPT3_KNICA
MAAHIQWFGRGGLSWSSLVPWLLHLLRGRSAPAVLLICCGSNDLGKVKSVDLVTAMKQDLHRRYPSMEGRPAGADQSGKMFY